MKPLFRKLDRLLTAMTYAEAGDLDAVKELLEQSDREAGKPCAPALQPVPLDAPDGRRMEGAKVLEFKRAKPAF